MRINIVNYLNNKINLQMKIKNLKNSLKKRKNGLFFKKSNLTKTYYYVD